MTWFTVPLNRITTGGQPLQGDQLVRLNQIDGRITEIEVRALGWRFQHAEDGALIDDAGRFDLSRFFLVNHNGTLNRDIPLTSKPGIHGTDAVIDRNCPVPCFAHGTLILMHNGVTRPVEKIRIGDRVSDAMSDDGLRVIWIGNRVVEVDASNAPIMIHGAIVSPQHRIAYKGGLIAAKHHPKARLAEWPNPVISYWHFLLERHAIVEAGACLAESLWPGSECMKMLGNELQGLVDAEAYRRSPAAPFLNKHGEVKA